VSLDDVTRRRIQKHKVPSAKITPALRRMLRESAAGPMARKLLQEYDAGTIRAVDFVELLRAWVNGE
jgi:hypothetical protein